MRAMVARQLETLQCVRSLSRALDELALAVHLLGSSTLQMARDEALRTQRRRSLARNDFVDHQASPNGKAHQGRQVGDA